MVAQEPPTNTPALRRAYNSDPGRRNRRSFTIDKSRARRVFITLRYFVRQMPIRACRIVQQMPIFCSKRAGLNRPTGVLFTHGHWNGPAAFPPGDEFIVLRPLGWKNPPGPVHFDPDRHHGAGRYATERKHLVGLRDAWRSHPAGDRSLCVFLADGEPLRPAQRQGLGLSDMVLSGARLAAAGGHLRRGGLVNPGG